MVADRSNIAFGEAHNGLSEPRRGNEFDLESPGFVGLDDRAEVTGAKSVLGQVSLEDDGLELRKCHVSSSGRR